MERQSNQPPPCAAPVIVFAIVNAVLPFHPRRARLRVQEVLHCQNRHDRLGSMEALRVREQRATGATSNGRLT